MTFSPILITPLTYVKDFFNPLSIYVNKWKRPLRNRYLKLTLPKTLWLKKGNHKNYFAVLIEYCVPYLNHVEGIRINLKQITQKF